MYSAFGPEKYPGNPVQTYLDQAVTPAVYAQELAHRRARFWLAETADGQPMGFVRLHPHAPPRQLPARYRQTGTGLEIERLYLLEPFIGQGFGGQLMAFCLDEARQQGHRYVWLGVWEHNASARAFYEKMGFQPFGWHYFSFGGEQQRDIWLVLAL